MTASSTDGVFPSGHELTVRASDGVRLTMRVYGPPKGFRIVLSHGNGLAIDGYRVFWEPLIRTCQVVTFDIRQHGRSEGGGAWRHTWSQFSDDFEAIWLAICRDLGRAPTVGVFHSLSAVVSIWHVRRYGRRWDGLVLFDPPLLLPDGHPLQPLHRAEMISLVDRVRRRRTVYDTPGQLAAQFERQPAFQRWEHRAFGDMARAILKPADGKWILCCPPELEARIYDTNMDPTLWARLHTDVPLKLVCGDPAVVGVQPSALTGRAAATELGLDYEAVPETTHFLQIERPDACRAIVEAFCRRHFLPAASTETVATNNERDEGDAHVTFAR